jgi:hypothetical protein
MRVLRNFLSFVAKRVLHIRCGRNSPADDGLGRQNGVGRASIRTYTAGGDPFEDRIEFHLAGQAANRGGFRDPRA